MILTLNIDKSVFTPFWLLLIFQRWVLVRVMSLHILASPLQGLPTTRNINDYK